VGYGLVLPAVLRVRRLLSLLLSALPDLRVLRVVQPADRRLRTQRRGLRPLRWRRCGCSLQPPHRHLCAWRGGLWALWLARRGASVQPTHGNLRADAPGIERVWKLGFDGRAARGRLGSNQSVYEPTDGSHHTDD